MTSPRPAIYSDTKGPDDTLRILMHIVATPDVGFAMDAIALSMAVAKAVQGADMEYSLAAAPHHSQGMPYMPVATDSEHILTGKKSLAHATFAHLLVTPDEFVAISNDLIDAVQQDTRGTFKDDGAFDLRADGANFLSNVPGYGTRGTALGTEQKTDFVQWIDTHAKAYKAPHDIVANVIFNRQADLKARGSEAEKAIQWVSGNVAENKAPHWTTNVFDDAGQPVRFVADDFRAVSFPTGRTATSRLGIGVSDGIGCNTGLLHTALPKAEKITRFPIEVVRPHLSA